MRDQGFKPFGPRSLLYFFDTGGGQIPEIVGKEQVVWYRNLSASLRPSHRPALPALAFFHIPLEEYLSLYSPPNAVQPISSVMTTWD